MKLSDARALGLRLYFTTPFLTLTVTYTDPALAEAQSPEEEVQRPMAKVQGPDVRHWTLDIGRFWRLWALDIGLFLRRPVTVTASFALVLLASLLLYVRAPAPLPTATELLTRAAMAEQTALAQTGTILHRTINLEEKNVSGALMGKHKVEIWQSAERGITTRRLYNEQGQLVAGDWRRQDGVQTLYQHGARPRIQLLNPPSAIRNFEEAWQLSPQKNSLSLLETRRAPT